MKQKKCYGCFYVLNPESAENMHCNYAGIEGRTRVAQVYKMLGVDHMTDEAREMLSGYKCPFSKPTERPIPGAERIRQIEQEYHRRELKQKKIREELMGVKPGRGKRPSKYNWDRAMELHREGKNAREIAEALGCSRMLVQKWKNQENLCQSLGAKPKYDWELAHRMLREGFSTREIAAELGCGKTTVEEWKRRNGLQRKQQTAKAADG